MAALPDFHQIKYGNTMFLIPSFMLLIYQKSLCMEDKRSRFVVNKASTLLLPATEPLYTKISPFKVQVPNDPVGIQINDQFHIFDTLYY